MERKVYRKMRKEQIRLLERAKKYEYPEIEKEFLSQQGISVQRLQCVFHYFYQNNPYFNHGELVQEVRRCLQLKPEKMTEKSFINRCRHYLLPGYSKDTMFKSIKKQEMIASADDDWAKELLIISLIKYEIPEDRRSFLLSKCIQRNDYIVANDFLTEECFRKDFYVNGKKSLLGYLCSTGKIGRMSGLCNSPFRNMKSLYDKEQNKFLFSEDFEKVIRRDSEVDYFNWSYLGQLKIQNNPVIGALLKKLNFKLNFNAHYEYNINSNNNASMVEKAKKLVEKYDVKLSVTDPHYHTSVVIHSETAFINISYTVFEKIFVYKKADNSLAIGDSSGSKKQFSFFITPDLHFYAKLAKGGSYPLSIGSIMGNVARNDVFAPTQNIIFEELEKINPFFKDVFSDAQEAFLMPLPINEVFQYHNRKELILDRFKTAQGLHVKWNRINLNLSYLIIKSIPYVDEKSRQILLQQRVLSEYILEDLSKKRKVKLRDKIVCFLVEIICRNIARCTKIDLAVKDVLKSDVQAYMQTYAEDYVGMSIRNHKKISLAIRTEQELIKKHDYINNYVDYDEKTAAVNIPKETVFMSLHKQLPESFEWIKTRKRLIMETRIQHHCVWQYANKITKDKCAIYSYADQEGKFDEDGRAKRYTIEFAYESGKYHVKQVQGKYDKVNTSVIRNYICTLLDDSLKKG